MADIALIGNMQKGEEEIITNKNGGRILHRILHDHQGYASYEETVDGHMVFRGYSYMDQDHSHDGAESDESHTHRQHTCLGAGRSRPSVVHGRVGVSDRTDPCHNNLA